MIFRSFTHFLGIYLFIFRILEKEKHFPAHGPASGPQATASRVHGLLSVAGRHGHGLSARPTSQPGQLWLWRVTSTKSAVTAAAVGAAAWPVVACRWPRWEEVANTSKRGPRSMRRARRGAMGLTEVAHHHWGGGAAVAWQVSNSDDALWRPMVILKVHEDQRKKEHDKYNPFWLGEGEQRSSPWSKEGSGLSAGGARGRLLHGVAPECGISSARCHIPFRDSGNEASIHVPKMFHSHV
jgi:hypothetical protein